MQNSQEPSLDLIKRYYQEVYQPNQLVSLIGLADFRQREFGFFLPDNIFVRNISFRSPSAIKEFLSTRVPLQASIGAVYDTPPSKEHPILQINWKYRELIFDIDLNEYDAVRTCGCTGASSYCVECWSLMNDAMLFLDDTLRTDFGFNQLYWFFSGRRGVHLWVFDDTAKSLNQDARTAIINYITMLRGDEYPFRIEPLPKYAKLLYARLIEVLATSYARFTSIEDLQAQGFQKKEALIFKESVASKMFTRKSFASILPRDVQPEKLLHQVIRMRYPRIDHGVTIDTRHLLRVVGTVHSGTGRICTLIDDITKFYPTMAPTIWDFL